MSNVISHRGFTAIFNEESGNWDIHNEGMRIGYSRGVIGSLHPLFYQADFGLSVRVLRIVCNLIQKIDTLDNNL